MTIPDPIYLSTVLTIGGDTAYDADGDAYDGSAVKVEPSAGQLAQGLRPERQLAAQHRNWIDQQFAAILGALIVAEAAQDVRLDADDVTLADHEARVDVLENYVTNLSPRIRLYTFLTSSTFVVPTRCVIAIGYGCGGGGGGGKGSSGINTIDRWIAGAGGGGGALASMQVIGGANGPLVPAETLNVDIGAGGASQDTVGATGNDGGDTIVRRGATVLNTWRGAQGGRGAVGAHTITYWVHFSAGGAPVRGTPVQLIGPAGQGIRWDSSTANPFGKTSDGGPHSLYIPVLPAQGGFGAGGSTNPSASAGANNPVGNFAPGAAGFKGTDGNPNVPPGDTDKRGGGGGGGGGAGPFGPGGGGGQGTHGEAMPSCSGDTAGANSGAGGGGSGSVAYKDVTNFPSLGTSVGGGGGSGRLYILTVEESP